MSRLAIASLVLLMLLAGCGSPTDNARSAVSNMQSVISTYDKSRPASLSATADACRTAYDDLDKSSSILTTNLGPKQANEQRALRAAYRSARAGFLKCSTGASALNFPMLAAAEQDIASANRAIRRAQELER